MWRVLTVEAKGSFRVYAKLRERFAHFPPEVWADPEELLSLLTRADIYKSVIFADVGLPIGIEHVVRNRGVIQESEYLDKMGKSVDLERIASELKQKVPDEIRSQLRQAFQSEDLRKPYRVLQAYQRSYRGATSANAIAVLLRDFPPEKVQGIARQALSDSAEATLASEIFNSEFLLDPVLLHEEAYRRDLNRYLTLQLQGEVYRNTENTDEARRLVAKAQLILDRYVDDLVHLDKLQELVDADYKLVPRILQRVSRYPTVNNWLSMMILISLNKRQLPETTLCSFRGPA